jgi:hypothetical protein
MKILLHRPGRNNSKPRQCPAAELFSSRLMSGQAACDGPLRRLGLDCIDEREIVGERALPQTVN